MVYVTATMPYAMLLVLFVNGLLLDGSMDGIKYYISPKWERLLDPEVRNMLLDFVRCGNSVRGLLSTKYCQLQLFEGYSLKSTWY